MWLHAGLFFFLAVRAGAYLKEQISKKAKVK
jgi:hypothetical protein